jgi:hypothetical protein
MNIMSGAESCAIALKILVHELKQKFIIKKEYIKWQ